MKRILMVAAAGLALGACDSLNVQDSPFVQKREFMELCLDGGNTREVCECQHRELADVLTTDEMAVFLASTRSARDGRLDLQAQSDMIRERGIDEGEMLAKLGGAGLSILGKCIVGAP